MDSKSISEDKRIKISRYFECRNETFLSEHVSVSIGKLWSDIRQATVAVNLSEYKTLPVGQIRAAWLAVVVLCITED